MNYASALGCPVNSTVPDSATLAQLFDWFLSLGIPYETLSNVEMGVLIKNADQMLTAIRSGGGGHCVEHAVLLHAVLSDCGFEAQLLNADFHDHRAGVLVQVAKPLVAVQLGSELWVCDPYYRALLYRVPANGTHTWDNWQVNRVNGHRFTLARRHQGQIVDEDIADFALTLQVRQAQFEQRYQQFSPFGVTAPFFQILRPQRRAVFYDPAADALVAVEGNTFWHCTPQQLTTLPWLPPALVERTLTALPALRQQRHPAADFIATGLFPPYYLRLQHGGTLPANQLT